jgi:hypothetical protein
VKRTLIVIVAAALEKGRFMAALEFLKKAKEYRS